MEGCLQNEELVEVLSCNAMGHEILDEANEQDNHSSVRIGDTEAEETIASEETEKHI